MSQPQQFQIQAVSVTYNTTHGKALTLWARLGIEPMSSCIPVRFLTLSHDGKSWYLTFNFWGTFILFSIGTIPIFIPTSSAREGPLFFTSSPTFVIVCLCDDSHFNSCEMISYWGSLSGWLRMLSTFSYILCIFAYLWRNFYSGPLSIFK